VPRSSRVFFVSGLLAAGLALTACSSSSPSTAAGNGAGGAPGGNEQAAAGDGGAEAPSVPFTHPTFRYTIGAPGPMAVQAGGEAVYTGKSDYLRITPVDGPTDALAAAKADAGGSGVAGFAIVQPARSVTISGKPAAYLEFTRDAGTNAVTGKAQLAHVLRAYVPRAGGTFRIEYGGTVPASQWDPQGALDIVTTFQLGQ